VSQPILLLRNTTATHTQAHTHTHTRARMHANLRPKTTLTHSLDRRPATPSATAPAGSRSGAANSKTRSTKPCATTGRASCQWPTRGQTQTAPSERPRARRCLCAAFFVLFFGGEEGGSWLVLGGEGWGGGILRDAVGDGVAAEVTAKGAASLARGSGRGQGTRDARLKIRLHDCPQQPAHRPGRQVPY
jgi:hypothetical protein